MAFTDMNGTTFFPFFYNVDAGVGPTLGGHYGTSDVQLVQWMLKRIWLGRDRFTPPFGKAPSPGDLQVTGIFDWTTQYWIRKYQEEEKRRGGKITIDGRVDRSKGDGMGTISHTFYTIRFMNVRLRQAWPEFFADPNTDPLCPPDLAKRLHPSG
jgi:hypothetical protein